MTSRARLAGESRCAPAEPADSEVGPLARGLGSLYIALSLLVGFGAVSVGPSVVYLVFLLGAGMLLLVGRSELLRIRMVGPAVGFAVWSVASIAWTASWAWTMLSLKSTLPLIIMTVPVASVLPMKDLRRALVRGIQLVTVVTFLTLAVNPSSRLFYSHLPEAGGAWRGGFDHKNALATFAAFAVPTVLAFGQPGWERSASIGALVVLILGSTSATGLGGLLVGGFCWWWLRLLSRRQQRDRSDIIVVTGCLVAVFAFAAWTSLSTIAGFYGKDLTLTGRTKIWSAVVREIGERPLLGYGPNGFYAGYLNDRSAEVVNQVGFWHNHAHNGLLELQLALGVVGVVLVLTLLLMCVIDAVRLFDRQPVVSPWLVSSALAIAVMSLSERTLTGAGWMSALVVMRVIAIRARDEGPDRGSGDASAPRTLSLSRRSG